MTELQDLIGIYGAVDRALATDPTRVAAAAALLPAYDGGAAVGWFDEFTAWTAQRTGVGPAEQYPDLDRALAGLAEVTPSAHMAARRLLAIAVASTVVDEVRLHGSDDELIVRALTAPGLAADEHGAERLLDRLRSADPGELGRTDEIDPWAALLDDARAEGLISPAVARQASAPPCSGRLVALPGPGGPAVALTSSFCTTELTLAEAKAFLEPSNWPGCHPLWCEMTQTGVSSAGNPVYREVVSVDCDNRDEVWTAEVCLEFRFIDLPDGAIATYDLCEGSPQPGDLVVVDSGSLVLREQGGELCVLATKRIKFDHPFDGPSLAMLACALGYGSVAEAMVFSCALGAGTEGRGSGTTFPGRDPADILQDDGGATTRPSSVPDGQTALDDVMGAAVGAATTCIEDCAQAYQASYGRVQARTYSPDDLVQDVADMWLRAVRDVGLVADLGLRTARVAAGRAGPTRQPSP